MSRERKYILIGGLILLIIGTIYRFFPENAMFSEKNKLIIKQKQLVKYQKRVKNKDALQARLVAVNRAMFQAESGLLNGKTSALAAVDIQNLLNEIAGRSQTEIQSMRVFPPKKPKAEENYIAIPVQVNLTANIKQIKEMIYRIETSAKHLKISALKIRLPNIKILDKISASFTVQGFMKTPVSRQKS